MKPRPWKTVRKVSATGECLGVISYLSLASFSSLPLFVRYALGVQFQLGRSPGLIGYSTEAHFLRRQFWTLSTWQDEKSLRDFVEQAPHGTSMIKLKERADASGFTTWIVSEPATPLDWTEARERLAQAKANNGERRDHGAVSTGGPKRIGANPRVRQP